ncbi:hypothetical protein PORY_000284 [Pneumocystis oryctolagi]|uniref:Uncharacterized protein n=1 Tax=Pneumocystis oryctolagi TaxID=42067 RepID=A0ACB7CFD3_9ASCO|nr:hypothetical protein PORY_000284 [Pneumocystis oryctolagi]
MHFLFLRPPPWLKCFNSNDAIILSKRISPNPMFPIPEQNFPIFFSLASCLTIMFAFIGDGAYSSIDGGESLKSYKEIGTIRFLTMPV